MSDETYDEPSGGAFTTADTSTHTAYNGAAAIGTKVFIFERHVSPSRLICSCFFQVYFAGAKALYKVGVFDVLTNQFSTMPITETNGDAYTGNAGWRGVMSIGILPIAPCGCSGLVTLNQNNLMGDVGLSAQFPKGDYTFKKFLAIGGSAFNNQVSSIRVPSGLTLTLTLTLTGVFYQSPVGLQGDGISE